MILPFVRCVLCASLLMLVPASEPLHAQAMDDFDALDRQVSDLYSQSKFADAIQAAERYAAAALQRHGEQHMRFVAAISWSGKILQAQDRYAEAVPFHERALSLLEKMAPDHEDIGPVLSNLGQLYQVLGRYTEAEKLLNRDLAITEKAPGPRGSDLAISLTALADLYASQDRFADAEPLYRRVVTIKEKFLGPEHQDVEAMLDTLAWTALKNRNFASAASSWRRATTILQRRIGKVGATTRGGNAERKRHYFENLIKTTHRLAATNPTEQMQQALEMFEMAQWGVASEAAASLAQMAARFADGSSEFAHLIQEQRDLGVQRQIMEEQLGALLGERSPRRDEANEKGLRDRLAAIDDRLNELYIRIAKDFPGHAELASPKPLSVAEVQAELRDDEALLLFFDTGMGSVIGPGPLPEESFVWVVTRRTVRWVPTEISKEGIRREVAALRCGLDAAAWDVEGPHKCTDLLKIEADSPLPFSTARAHKFYRALFGKVEKLIRGKHLLIVPSGSLTQLPFHVLVTTAPATNDYRSAAWLARKNHISVLPAVSSLKSLRGAAKPSTATKPMLGVGNPLLDGNPAERPWEAQWAKLAREKQTCPPTPKLWQRVAGLIEKRRGARNIMRSGRADIDLLRSQAPLHETADELCAVARDLRADTDDILLGANATEANIKKLSGESKLISYRVVHFATHGVMPSELEGDSEPGLILTPPEQQGDIDDGYLSASEVASLKLDADWVILSACNTAAGDFETLEPLSGLARAFFHAGARSLLVSHWAVNSAATVKLITAAVASTARDRKLGRAEALRRAMLTMIDKGELDDAHPSNWAPFVLVGEGAAVR